MIWVATFGYAFFSETPSVAVVAGATVVAGAGLLVLWRERLRRGVRPDTDPVEVLDTL
jgi:drug/metabolite transporter (DMT)-like permease